jgi:type IV secretory pathway VirJ component
VIVSSGDGGWIHLGPHVARLLASQGFFVVGFDVKTYLTSFTSDTAALRIEDEPADFRVLIDYARQGSLERPILIGVSEGAGLSVLAAADAATRPRLAGVIGLGLPDKNELGWRWRDSLIYITHGTPNEPCFSVARVVRQMAPAPLAAIYSTHDEFVTPDEARRLMQAADEPKRFWSVPAADHRFSDNRPELARCLR